MFIGICYDLKDDYLKLGFTPEEAAEFDLPETIFAIEQALNSCGFQTERIGNLFNLVEQLAAKRKWDLIFNIAEGISGFGREAAIPAILDQYRIAYTFSDPLTLAVCLHKGMCKRMLSYHRLATAPFIEVSFLDELDPEKLALDYPLFAKPVAEGTSKGISRASRIDSPRFLQTIITDLLQRFRQPVLLEEFLPGREITVGVVGTGRNARLIGAVEVRLRANAESEVYSLHNKQNYRECVEYLPLQREEIEEITPLVLKTWHVLNCRDAGRIDLRYDRYGQLNVMEVNPLAGLHPIDSDLPIICGHFKISYQQLIASIVESALQRKGNGN